MHRHPEIDLVSRDRGKIFRDAATQGAPQAKQVVDRFHLQKKFTEALEKFFRKHEHALKTATQSCAGKTRSAASSSKESGVNTVHGFSARSPKSKGTKGISSSGTVRYPGNLAHGTKAHGNAVRVLVQSLKTESGLPNRRQDLAKRPEERMGLLGIPKVLDTGFTSEGSYLPRRASDIIDHTLVEGIDPLSGKVSIHKLQIAVKDPFKRVKIHQHKATTRRENSGYSPCPQGEVGEPMHNAIGTKHDVKLPGALLRLLQPVVDVSALKCSGDVGDRGTIAEQRQSPHR